MGLWIYITVYFAWNFNKDAFEFEANPLKKSRDSGFFICFGVIYTLLIIVLPVWLSQDPFNLDVLTGFPIVLLAFGILILAIFTYRTTKRAFLKKPSRRLIFLMRISLINSWFLGILVALSALFIISIVSGGGIGISV